MREALWVSKTGVDVLISSHYICTFVMITYSLWLDRCATGVGKDKYKVHVHEFSY